MNNTTLKLANHDRLELCEARGSTLQIARGSVRVTHDVSRSDVVLTAGDSWTIEHYGLTVVEARGDAQLALVGSIFAGIRVRSRGVRWQARLARWLERAAERQLRPRWVPWL